MDNFMQMSYAIQSRLDEIRPVVATYRIAMESRWFAAGLGGTYIPTLLRRPRNCPEIATTHSILRKLSYVALAGRFT